MNEFETIRAEYDVAGLDIDSVSRNPIIQFRAWFDDAVAAGVPEPNTMTMATVSGGGPKARAVLLKGIEDDGFVFYSNYESDKGRQLETHPSAALVFYWQPLHRQVRVEGGVVKVPAAQSDDYFRSRPRGAQLAAAASDQSRRIGDRDELHARFKAVEAAYQGRDVPRPEQWGGYRVEPRRIEFWQGQLNRLHDRLVYERTPTGWLVGRLNP